MAYYDDIYYSPEELELIQSSEGYVSGSVPNYPGDFVRLVIYNKNDMQTKKWVDSDGDIRDTVYYSTLSEGSFYFHEPGFELPKRGVNTRILPPNDFPIYENKNTETSSLYIKPNEILSSSLLPSGDYEVYFNFQNQFIPINPAFDDGEYGQIPFPQYFEELDINKDGVIDILDVSAWKEVGRPDIADYIETNLSTLQPTYGLVEARPLSDFFWPTIANFITREVSPSRLEIRLKLYSEDRDLDTKIKRNSKFIQQLKDELNLPNTNKYAHKHSLYFGEGISRKIANFTFDDRSDGREDQSVIIKLLDAIPGNININSSVSLEKQLHVSNREDIRYTIPLPSLKRGVGLTQDDTENWIESNQDTNNYENYNQLSSSLSDASLQNLISGSTYDYPNLNNDFKSFENHTFFGSAKRKLENFEVKVKNIQGHYSRISSSLTAEGIVISNQFITGSGNERIETDTSVVTDRKELFNKIQEEINSFTPYERFLYYDGQSVSTASAPGVGKNYADTYAINQQTAKELGEESYVEEYSEYFDNKDGLPQVYKITQSFNTISPTNIFEHKYRVENKPFFNYSGSVYLSFLVKGDSTFHQVTSSGTASLDTVYPDNLVHDFNYSKYSGIETPRDSMYINLIQSASLTGSEYRRYITQVSSSYWIPTLDVGYPPDAADVDIFTANSSEVEVLSGSVKTTNESSSAQAIKASGYYQHLATIATGSSGVPFTGSIMPSGDIFNIKASKPYITNLQGYWNVDNQTSGSTADATIMKDLSENSNTASITGVPKVANGVERFGKTYGQSIQFLSESFDEVRFETDNFNFGKEDDFSLSIWVKRFHPNTGSADPTTKSRHGIFGKGQYDNSYGMDYNIGSNVIRAGFRKSGSADFLGKTAFSYSPGDDLLNWHHLVMTYESGSTTGLKLYDNGVMVKSQTVAGSDGWSITGSANFTSSTSELSDQSNMLTMGGDTNFASGQLGYFNGFLAYPRVYDRTLDSNDVKKLYLTPDGISRAEITDVKVSLNNPSDVLPFDNLYHTSSTSWQNWYDGIHDSASAFDEGNIHSLENNLPEYIKQSSEYYDLKQFLALIGEHFDIIRNHIDNYTTIYNRNYDDVNSVPTNLMPLLLDTLNWEAIQPFSSSLADYFGQHLSSATNVKTISENTWRKTLNNLIYLYKSKGTINSIRGLLNIYGYPPDVLKINEYGGSNEPQNDAPISPTASLGTTTNDTNLGVAPGNVGYVLKKEKLHNYRFNGNPNRPFKLNWYYDEADANALQFVYKHNKTKNTQEIFKSSGSGAQTLWDLRLIPSVDGLSSSFEFRLNNSENGGSSITNRGFSMSLDYNSMVDGQLWNVLVQRMTSSISGTGIQEYQLYSGLQDEDKIKKLSFVTMSVSGGVTANHGYYANQNWPSTGSRTKVDSPNLFVGRTTSGSLSEIRNWKNALSASKFRLHTLNKFSTVGNTINSHKDELIYRFKLNENYASSSVSSSTQTKLSIGDSAPKVNLTTDYSFNISSSTARSESLYGFDIIETNTISLQDNNSDLANDNKVIINPNIKLIKNLNPYDTSIISLYDDNDRKPNRLVSSKIEIDSSPQNYVNNFILDKIQGFNLETLYANPMEKYSSSYGELDTFRDTFYENYPIKIDTNKFIKAHENLWNYNLVDGIKKLVPARTTLSDKEYTVGITIKPTILEKQKAMEYKNHSIEPNPNLLSDTISVVSSSGYKSGFSISDSFEPFKEGSVNVNDNLDLNESEIKLTNDAEVKVSTIPTLSDSILNKTIDSDINITSNFTAEIPNVPEGVNNYISINNYSKFVDFHNSWGTSSHDVHFLNMATSNAQTSSDGDYNVNHVDTRYHFYALGDIESYSGSTGNYDDFSTSTRFDNRQQLKQGVHKNIRYESFVNGNPGLQKGRAMGKTRFFKVLSSGTTFAGKPAGDIILPSNHVRRYSNPWVDSMYAGAQNTNPGILPFAGKEDYSTASFYRVKVTGGENQMIIRTPGGPENDLQVIIPDDKAAGDNIMT